MAAETSLKPCLRRYSSMRAMEEGLDGMLGLGFRLNSWHPCSELVSETERVAEISVTTTKGTTAFYALYVPTQPAPPPTVTQQPMSCT